MSKIISIGQFKPSPFDIPEFIITSASVLYEVFFDLIKFPLLYQSILDTEESGRLVNKVSFAQFPELVIATVGIGLIVNVAGES